MEFRLYDEYENKFVYNVYLMQGGDYIDSDLKHYDKETFRFDMASPFDDINGLTIFDNDILKDKLGNLYYVEKKQGIYSNFFNIIDKKTKEVEDFLTKENSEKYEVVTYDKIKKY